MLLLSTLLACASPALDGSPEGSFEEPGAAPAQPSSPSSEQACREGRSTNTKVSVASGTAVVDHFEGGERSERVVVAFADVERIELDVVLEPARCAAIWLALRDGRRVLFDDDERADLAPRARRLAETLRVPFADATVAQNG